MLQSGVVGQRVILTSLDSGAVFICVYNEYMNFGDENGIAFSFYFYTLPLYCVCHCRSVAFVYSGADRENLTV